MSHPHWHYAALMRQGGFRVTVQRQLVLDAVCEGGGHTTADEIYTRTHARMPAISRATVYRVLAFLCDLHLVTRVDVGGGQRAYEIAGEAPHHHLVCERCGAVEQIGHAMVKALFMKVEREHSFQVTTDHLALFGLCRTCRQDTG